MKSNNNRFLLVYECRRSNYKQNLSMLFIVKSTDIATKIRL